jgi:hypothetical protein
MNGVVLHYGVIFSFQAFTLFLPAIIQGFGYKSVTANLLTVPVYLWGMIWLVIIAFYSDRLRGRGVVVAGLDRFSLELTNRSNHLRHHWRDNSPKRYQFNCKIYRMLHFRYGDLPRAFGHNVAHR